MTNKKPQADKFREAAREVETNDDEKQFDENLKKLAKSKPQKQGWFFEFSACYEQP